jgi:hypothetical protein
MLLKTQGLWSPPLSAKLYAMVPSHSLWTIDLCAMLRTLGVSGVALHTQQAGVNPSFKSLPYYEASLSTEAGRITSAFSAAASSGIAVHAPSSLTAEYLTTHLQARSRLFIVLVDARLLACESCQPQPPQAVEGASYQGHYLFLTGYDPATDLVSYYNPSPKANPLGCSVKLHTLEAARRAHGTDEDVLEVAVAEQG